MEEANDGDDCEEVFWDTMTNIHQQAMKVFLDPWKLSIQTIQYYKAITFHQVSMEDFSTRVMQDTENDVVHSSIHVIEYISLGTFRYILSGAWN
jgi:hypothetical protein